MCGILYHAVDANMIIMNEILWHWQYINGRGDTQ